MKELFRRQGEQAPELMEFDAQGGVMLDVSSAQPLDEHNRIANLLIGDTRLRVYKATEFSAVMLTRDDIDEEVLFGQARTDQRVRGKDLPIFVDPDKPVALGRTETSAHRLGLDTDMLVSKKHATISLTQDGVLTVKDEASRNGTTIEVDAQTEVFPRRKRLIRAVGATGLSRTVTKIR